ncbi:hypothetical protein CDE51_12325, partial [Pasteurella multocida]
VALLFKMMNICEMVYVIDIVLHEKKKSLCSPNNACPVALLFKMMNICEMVYVIDIVLHEKKKSLCSPN